MRKNKYRLTLWIGSTPFSTGCKTIGEAIDALEAAVGRPMDQRQFKAVLRIATELVLGNKSAECDLTSSKAPMRVTLAYNAR